MLNNLLCSPHNFWLEQNFSIGSFLLRWQRGSEKCQRCGNFLSLCICICSTFLRLSIKHLWCIFQFIFRFIFIFVKCRLHFSTQFDFQISTFATALFVIILRFSHSASSQFTPLPGIQQAFLRLFLSDISSETPVKNLLH